MLPAQVLGWQTIHQNRPAPIPQGLQRPCHSHLACDQNIVLFDLLQRSLPYTPPSNLSIREKLKKELSFLPI
jgi:hypothetical protein